MNPYSGKSTLAGVLRSAALVIGVYYGASTLSEYRKMRDHALVMKVKGLEDELKAAKGGETLLPSAKDSASHH